MFHGSSQKVDSILILGFITLLLPVNFLAFGIFYQQKNYLEDKVLNNIYL